MNSTGVNFKRIKLSVRESQKRAEDFFLCILQIKCLSYAHTETKTYSKTPLVPLHLYFTKRMLNLLARLFKLVLR